MEVARFDHGRQEPSLVFYKGAYMMLTQSLRELAAGGRLEPQHLDQARRLVNCMLLRLGLVCARRLPRRDENLHLRAVETEAHVFDPHTEQRLA